MPAVLQQISIANAIIFLSFQLKCCGLKLRKDGPEKPWEAWLRNTQVNSGDADKKVSILLRMCCIFTYVS